MGFPQRAIYRGLQEAKNVAFLVVAALGGRKERIENDVPYICQFAVPESAEKILEKEMAPIDDPNWRMSGAASPEQYAVFAPNICGVAAVAMTMRYFGKPVDKLLPLAEDALRDGVYRSGEAGLSDMRYREFANWVSKFGLQASVYTRLGLKGVQYALSHGDLVVASVNPNIRGYATSAEHQKGGHLVLVTGYDRKNGTMTINNPSGFSSLKSQKGHVLSDKQFLRYFAGRGVVIRRA